MLSQDVLDEQDIPGCPKTLVKREVEMPTASPGFDSPPASPPWRLLLYINPAFSWDTDNLAASLSFVSVISLGGQQLSSLFTH